jgi:hypothetical protein
MKHLTKYNKFFENNSPLTLYHGSFSKFNRFDISKIRKSGSQTTYGVGIYATDNINYAKSYISGENGDIDSNGYLYRLEILNGNFLNFGEYINGGIQHSIIDSDNYNKIKTQLEKEGIILKDIEPTDTVWQIFNKLFRNILDNVFTMKQKFNYGDFYAKKEVAEFLTRCGIDGLKYPLETSSKISTSYGYKGYGYVLYDSNIITNVKIVDI